MSNDLVRVTNNRPTLLHGPDNVTFTKAGDGADRTLSVPGLTFGMGGNNVDRAQLAAAKKNATVQSWFRLGWLTEGGDTSAKEGVPPPETLANYNETTAVALVEDEGDLSALKRWEMQEERPQVRTALKKKLEAIGAEANGKRGK